MSSGRNLTQRQRRGRSIFNPLLLPPIRFQITAADAGAGTQTLTFDTPVVCSPVVADYEDWGTIEDSAEHITAVQQIDELTLNLTWSAIANINSGFGSPGHHYPIQSLAGQAVGPWFLQSMDAGSLWPVEYR